MEKIKHLKKKYLISLINSVVIPRDVVQISAQEHGSTEDIGSVMVTESSRQINKTCLLTNTDLNLPRRALLAFQ